MKFDVAFLVRLAVVGVALSYVFEDEGGGGEPTPSGPYTGSMASLHSTSRAMSAEDREVLSDAFTAGGRMVAADKKGLIDKTPEAQSLVIALLEFDYNGTFQVNSRYPGLSAAVETELTKCIGDEVKPMDASDRSRFAECLSEMGRAVR